jgi:type VI secretion system protein ImpM
MACGLFGKLQTKRDFVTVDLPRSFVIIWEEWLQQAIAQSQTSLGDEWLATYLSAPLWRFRLGAKTSGEDLPGGEITGVIMPSVDGIGRKFPLTVAFCAAPGASLASPESAEADAWYASVEDFMLHLLDSEPSYEQSLEALRALPDFPPGPDIDDIEIGFSDAHGFFAQCDAEKLPVVLEQLQEREGARLLQKSSLWWTIGGSDWPAAGFMCGGLPSGEAFTAMLSGGFASTSHETI